MKVAVVGLGVIGRVHARILRERGELFAVCDIDPTRFPEDQDLLCETDYLRLLDGLHPEAVHICTPHYLHASMVIAALERNIHVLCEKPLCISYAEIDAVLAAEKASKATLGVCFQNRYNPANAFVKEYLKDKAVLAGTGSVVWKRTREYYAADAWRGKWATEGGGVLINQAIHTLDLLQWLVGMPRTLTANLSTVALGDVIEVEDTASVFATDGAEFSLFATNASAKDFPVEIRLRTEEEQITILPHEVKVGETVHAFPKDAVIYGKPCYGAGHALLIEDFYRCIREGRHFPIDAEEGAKAVRLVLAAYESRGRSVSVGEQK